MTDYEFSGQESTDLKPTTDERRADWERFTMTVCGGPGGGYVNVRNDSHDNPGDHIHSVHVENGRADGCSCPHAVYRDAHCKHQRAVENRPLVLSSADAASAATTGQQVATDGGRDEKPDPDMRCEDCGKKWHEGTEGAACPACGSTERKPRRSTRADFGGGESTGVVDL